MNPVPERILVARGGALGDFILTLPVFAVLRQEFPQARIALLGHPETGSLAMAAGMVDEVKDLEARSLAEFFAPGGNPDASWRDYFAGFDLIISYLHDPEFIFRGQLSRCSKARFIQGCPRPDEKAGRHASEVFLDALGQLGIDGRDPVPRLNLRA